MRVTPADGIADIIRVVAGEYGITEEQILHPGADDTYDIADARTLIVLLAKQRGMAGVAALALGIPIGRRLDTLLTRGASWLVSRPDFKARAERGEEALSPRRHVAAPADRLLAIDDEVLAAVAAAMAAGCSARSTVAAIHTALRQHEPAERRCLGCDTVFYSKGKHNRLCPTCSAHGDAGGEYTLGTY